VSNTISTAYVTYLDVLVSEALRGAASVSISTPLHLSIRSWNEGSVLQMDYLAKARAMIVKLPGFVFSSYRQTAGISSVIIAMDEYTRVMKDVDGVYPTPRLPPKQKLLIRLTPSASRDQREDVINGLRTFFKSDKTQAVNTWSLIATMDQAIEIMNLFFQLVGAIAMVRCTTAWANTRASRIDENASRVGSSLISFVLPVQIMSFFILWLSFTANVEENMWEYGVLRAIGLNVRPLIHTSAQR
jgi:hypothetical protein